MKELFIQHTAAAMCKQLNLVEFKCLAVGQSGILCVQYKRKGHARTCKDLFVLSPSTRPDPERSKRQHYVFVPRAEGSCLYLALFSILTQQN